MRNRQKQRENRKKKGEESLSTRNDEGYRDLTAFNAVERIKRDKTDRRA
jgi:hypothetical protein